MKFTVSVFSFCKQKWFFFPRQRKLQPFISWGGRLGQSSRPDQRSSILPAKSKLRASVCVSPTFCQAERFRTSLGGWGGVDGGWRGGGASLGSARPSESVLWLVFHWTPATLSAAAAAAAASGQIKQTSRSVESSPKEASLALKQWKRKKQWKGKNEKNKKKTKHSSLCGSSSCWAEKAANKQFEEESSVNLSRTWQPPLAYC